MGLDANQKGFGGYRDRRDPPDWVQDLAKCYLSYLELRAQIKKGIGSADDSGSIRSDCDFAVHECFRDLLKSVKNMLPQSVWLNKVKGANRDLQSAEDRFYLPQTHELFSLRRPEYFDFVQKYDDTRRVGADSPHEQMDAKSRSKVNFELYHPDSKSFVGFDKIRTILERAQQQELSAPVTFAVVKGVESREIDMGSQLTMKEAFKVLRISRELIDASSQDRLDDTAEQIARIVRTYNEHRVSALDEYGIRMKESLQEFIMALSTELKEQIPKSISYKTESEEFAFLVDSMELVQVSPSLPNSGPRSWLDKLRARSNRSNEETASTQNPAPQEWIRASEFVMRQLTFVMGPMNIKMLNDLVATPKWAR